MSESKNSSSDLILYQTEDGGTRLEVRLQDQTVWLTQKLIAELFQKDVRTINEHIQNIFEERELDPNSVIRKFRITASDGKSYETQHYNLDVIIAVGYRVKSHRGTQFRVWATQRLREYIVKGFAVDDERLKQPGGGDYFDELLQRICAPQVGRYRGRRAICQINRRPDQAFQIRRAGKTKVEEEMKRNTMRRAGLSFSAMEHLYCATKSAPLRSLTWKMGQSGSFALPLLIAAFLCVISLTGFSADTDALAKLQDVHRIVFLGDSITYAGGYVDDVEAYYVTRFPERHFEFVNVGLSSETVSGLSEPSEKNPRPDLHERLGRVLEKAKPTMVFVCYGMNDGIYSPPDDARFKAFQEGMKSVHEQIAAAGIKNIIHVTPPVFDPIGAKARISTNGSFGFSHPYENYNKTLDQFSDWLVAQRKGGWQVADLHSGMNQWLADQRKRAPDFNYTKDGVHPDANGHWVMAKQVLLYLGAKDVENADSPSAMVASYPHGGEILKLVHEQEQLLRDAWLTVTKHTRPGVKAGLPLPEAEAKAAELDKKIRMLARPAPAAVAVNE